MKKICFNIEKGGEGKSTSSINLAAYLALNGQRVLVVDLDTQANTTSILLGRKSVVSFENVVRDNARPSDVIFPSLLENLHVLPSSPSLIYAQQPLRDDVAGGGEALRIFIEDHNLDAQYDYAIFDTPHGSTILQEVALIAADYAVIPVSPEKFSLDGLKSTVKKIQKIHEDYNENLQLLGVFLNRYILHRNYMKAIEMDLQDLFGDKFFKTRVRHNSSISQSFLLGKPVFLFSLKSIGAQDFSSLFDEMLDRITSPILTEVGQ